jgi:hypothetical protein
VQAFKQGGRWDQACAASKVFSSPTQWPFRENKPFWLRVTLDARGAFSYVDGRAYAFTPHPPSWDPARAHSLRRRDMRSALRPATSPA